jgi:serine/threonine protein kinase
MPSASADRNLLFAVLALQADCIDREQFIDACTAWAADKTTPMAELLVKRGWLSTEDRTIVEQLVERKLMKHQGDVQLSLTDVSGDHVRQALAMVQDAVRPPGTAPAQAGSIMGSGVAFMKRLGYEFVARLGSDMYSEVYQGTAPGGVPVAIKVMLHKLDKAEAQRELWALDLVRELRHPYLVSTLSFFIHDEELCIVTELADKSLRDRLKECRRSAQKGMSKRELWRYMAQVAEALDFLHERNLQHRDIKPDNIVLMSGYAKVGNFGLIRLMSPDDTLQKTVGGGTPMYMPPEAWRGTVHKHTDQYSLAATYVELRQGSPIFGTSDFMELARRHCEEAPDLSGLEKEEQSAVARALSKVPQQRFESCSKFVEALK